ncbi:MAG TPA: oxidoreductase [Acidimicrobiia bacterium]|nr:oxidoreductase [Acidimicrobiia bacterium]
MAWTERHIPDLGGKVALVTGGNGGLGLETARALAAARAHVILATRNPAKSAAAVELITRTVEDPLVEVRLLDLASLASIDDLTTGVRADFDRLDMLINNAGLMGIPEQRTADGFEMQFGVNHLGHYALTANLLPLLVRTPGSRVVSVTSTARHFGQPVDAANPHLHGTYDPWRAYGKSKLANLHFAIGLDQRLRTAGAPARSLVAHPGLTTTDLQPNSVRETGGGTSQRFWQWLAARTGMSPARGALAQLRAATDPTASGGQLYAPRFVNFGSAVRRPLLGRSRRQESIDTLFAVSRAETGLDIDVAAVMAEPTA